MQTSIPTALASSRPGQPTGAGADPVVVFDRVSLAFDDNVVLQEVSFTLLAGQMKIIMGASGAGKSTVLRLILGLLKPDSGRILVDGHRVDQMSESALMSVRANLGMVFQEGALFDSLTVRENTGYRLYEETNQPIRVVDDRVREVLGYVGLSEYAERMPAELSGGQRRRVAIARALTSRPRILLYDEPTTGLDPITALTIDAEIMKLRDLGHVSSIVVTHQLRDAFHIATHQAVQETGALRFEAVTGAARSETAFIMLKAGRVGFEGSASELRATNDPYLRAFLT